MPRTKTRIAGHGFTTLSYRGQAIAFMHTFHDSGQAPYGGQRPEAIFVLGQKHAVEIATPRILDTGVLTMSIRELWNGPVWEQLHGLEGTNDVIDVYERLSSDPTEVTCQMVVMPPGSTIWRGKVFHNCVVSAIDDAEHVEIGSMTISRDVAVAYTHAKRFSMPAGRIAA